MERGEYIQLLETNNIEEIIYQYHLEKGKISLNKEDFIQLLVSTINILQSVDLPRYLNLDNMIQQFVLEYYYEKFDIIRVFKGSKFMGYL